MAWLVGPLSSSTSWLPWRSKQTQAPDKAIKVFDAVSRLALLIFAAILKPFFCAVAFSAGFAFGLGESLYECWSQKSLRIEGFLKPLCGQGYMEWLTDRGYPRWSTHVVTVAFIGEHVRHDPLFFSPFVGLFIGRWAGNNIAAWSCPVGSRSISWIRSFQKPCCQ